VTPRLDEEHGGVTRRFCTTLTSHECLQAHNERDVQPKNDIQESSCFPVEICAYANCAMTERIKREQYCALAPPRPVLGTRTTQSFVPALPT